MLYNDFTVREALLQADLFGACDGLIPARSTSASPAGETSSPRRRVTMARSGPRSSVRRSSGPASARADRPGGPPQHERPVRCGVRRVHPDSVSGEEEMTRSAALALLLPALAVAAPVPKAKTPEVDVRDADGKVLLAADDLASYDWATHTLTL